RKRIRLLYRAYLSRTREMIERALGSRVMAVLALASVVLGTVVVAGGRHAIAGVPQAAPSTSPAVPAVSTNEVLTTYCTGCHNARLKTAGLQIDGLDATRVGQHADTWEKIVTKLRTGEMPPAGRPRPDAATYRSVVAALEKDLDAAA